MSPSLGLAVFILGQVSLSPCGIGEPERGCVLAETNFRRSRRDLGHERVYVSVDFGFFIPVGIDILIELLSLCDHVQQLAVPAVPALVGREAVEESMGRCFLQIRIERRIDAQAAFMHLITAVFRFEIAADFLDVVRSQRIRILLQVEHDRLALASAAWAAVILPSSSMALMTRLRRLIARSG